MKRCSYRRSSQRGGILLGLLLSGMVVVCLVIASGLFIARNIRVQTTERNGGDSVSIDTPAGHLSIRAHEKAGTAAVDAPVYPGARNVRDSGGDAVIEWNSGSRGDGNGFSMSASEMVTSDSLDEVLDY